MYKKILIVVDDQPTSQTAVRQGVEMARVHNAEAIFLYVLPNYSFPMVDVPPMAVLSAEQFIREARDTASGILASATEHAEGAGVLSHRSMGSGPDASSYVAEVAVKRQCGLIVVATEGRNAVMRLLTGSIVPGLITSASVPVMICPPDGKAPGKSRRAVVPGRVRRRKTSATNGGGPSPDMNA